MSVLKIIFVILLCIPLLYITLICVEKLYDDYVRK